MKTICTLLLILIFASCKTSLSVTEKTDNRITVKTFGHGKHKQTYIIVKH
jgi:hypothetical protein